MVDSSSSTGLLTLSEFLAEAAQFRLGQLPTEQPHPRTRDLARWAREDLGRAVDTLLDIDRGAVAVLLSRVDRLTELRRAVRGTLHDGDRVFLCGCGATGRLALSLETLWRTGHRGSLRADAVVSLMAGGDVALVRSIEGFEDAPELGARHLDWLGFGPNDLLVASTEGGETPYVIGAAERAAEVSRRRPWLLYCNPDEALRAIERSRRVIDDPRIATLSLPIGPMALSGSTRLQATTVLMLAMGLSLLASDEDGLIRRLNGLVAYLDQLDPAPLVGLIEAESAAYQAGDGVIYEADGHAITVLTDTTERAPTFNLTPFENQHLDEPEGSLCYLMIPATDDAESAWHHLLARPPRPLEWPDTRHLTGSTWLYGFDFSRRIAHHRKRRFPEQRQRRFRVERSGTQLRLDLEGHEARFEVADRSLLEEHVILKLLLNIHSTLVMGRLGRYRNNVMTWVRPSNRKLIDRAIRYVDQILSLNGGPELAYDELARHCFEAMAILTDNESIVLRTVERIRARGRPAGGCDPEGP